MMLHCTLVAAPGSALTGEPRELAIAAAAGCTGARLQEAVSRRYGTGRLSVEGRPLAGLTAGTAPLVNGAVLVDSLSPVPPRFGGMPVAAAALMLAVDGGPGAGAVFPLRRGRFRIGRSGAEITIPDAELSRQHARLDVTDAAVSIVDLGSANGTWVNGRKVREVAVTTGSQIQCGGSALSLHFDGGSVQSGGSGTPAGSGVAEPLVVINTAAGSNRTALVLAAGLPLALGVGLALLTGMWMFLAFTAVSAVAVLVPAAAGRRQRRELKSAVAAAARQDAERRRRAAPSAARLVLQGARGHSSGVDRAEETGPVWLRLGLAEQPANIRLEPADPGFRPPALGLMPLMLDPANAVTTVCGPETAVAGLVRFLIIQLAGYPFGRRTRVLIHGAPDSVPLAARFLSGVTLSCHGAALAGLLGAGPGEGFDRGLLIILDSTRATGGATPAAGPAAAGTATLQAAAANGGWQVIVCLAGTAPAGTAPAGTRAAPDASIILGGHTARLCTGRDEAIFVPDLVPQLVFDRYCRRLGSAACAAAAPPPATPDDCALADILVLSAAGISRRWAARPGTPGLPVPVGAGPSGPVMIDLQADGPHFLVAGTTGSGKSEFLRTLAAGLAASYPPDRINLLFIDFKGGSGLGPLAGLPHCVGMLTDLCPNEVDRTLVSLRAEVRRREEVLAAAQAPDLTAYEGLDPPLPALPHLILVIDEFRMLVEEAPGALTDLMRVAAIGRSLGIHLIMATQRPQGAITADIRANVTSRIALRVQSELESLDIMGSRLAAAIPISRPGRAFLVRGSEAPQEFQTAALMPPGPHPDEDTVAVFPVKEFLGSAPAGAQAGRGRAGAADLAPAAASLVQELSGLWTAMDGIPPYPPVAVPLPAALPFTTAGSAAARVPDTLPAGSGTPGAVRLGWVDVPENQRVAELHWHPAGHGHLGMVGGAAGAGDTALGLAVDQLLAGKDELHLYLLDGGGAFGAAAASARVGAVAGLHELGRAVRVLERVADEVTRRLGIPAPDDYPPITLVIAGWGSWTSAFRSGPRPWAEDLVHDIVRDGPKVAVTVLVSGERELVTARFFAAIPNRIFFPAGSTEESRLAWPRLPALEPVPGRVAVCGVFVPAGGAEAHRCQIFERPVPALQDALRPWDSGPSARRPFRIEPLPLLVTVTEVLGRLSPGTGRRALPAHRPGASGAGPPGRCAANMSLRLGIGGDELLPFAVPLPGGSVLAVLGGPAAGKSTLVAALPGLNPSVREWLAPGAGTDAGKFWEDVQARALAGGLARDAVLLADDVDLEQAETNRRLYELNSLGWTVIMTAGFGPALQQRVPLAHNARSLGKGVLICPRSLADGDLFGVRFEPEPGAPPGRAVVIMDGRAAAVQLATAQPAGAPVRAGSPGTATGPAGHRLPWKRRQ